jgi:GGDEF domain-containing protein
MRAAQSLTLPAFEATVAATPDHVRAALLRHADDAMYRVKRRSRGREAGR